MCSLPRGRRFKKFFSFSTPCNRFEEILLPKYCHTQVWNTKLMKPKQYILQSLIFTSPIDSFFNWLNQRIAWPLGKTETSDFAQVGSQTVDITILSAGGRPFSPLIGPCKALGSLQSSTGLPKADRTGHSDPYVVVQASEGKPTGVDPCSRVWGG